MDTRAFWLTIALHGSQISRRLVGLSVRCATSTAVESRPLFLRGRDGFPPAGNSRPRLVFPSDGAVLPRTRTFKTSPGFWPSRWVLSSRSLRFIGLTGSTSTATLPRLSKVRVRGCTGACGLRLLSVLWPLPPLFGVALGRLGLHRAGMRTLRAIHEWSLFLGRVFASCGPKIKTASCGRGEAACRRWRCRRAGGVRFARERFRTAGVWRRVLALLLLDRGCSRSRSLRSLAF
jgi:hypothetical protein